MTSPNPSARGWVEFRLAGPLLALEVFADFMNDLGAGGAIFSEDPESGDGGQMVTAFLPAAKAGQSVADRVQARAGELRQDFPGDWSDLVSIRVVADQDWGEEWKKNLVAQRLEPGLWIVPSFLEVPAEAQGEAVIRLDPGLAFGTGQHVTTQLCLPAVHSAIKSGALSVLDLGTGTGILAMAAALFGARRILAMDIDPIAQRVAEENMKANGLREKIELKQGVADPETILEGPPFDLIVANLFAEAIVRLLPFLNRHLAPEGTLALSGILSERAELVLSALKEKKLNVKEKKEEAGWIMLVVTRDGSQS